MQAIAELDDLVLDLPRFEQALHQFAAKLRLDLAAFTADHISLLSSERHCRTLAPGADAVRDTAVRVDDQRATYLSVRFVAAAGRGAVADRLRRAAVSREKRYPHEGWEHVELVLSGDPQTLHARALSLLADEALLTPGIKLKQSSPKGEGERLPNPTLAITDGTVTLKFHPYSIRDIVASEQG